MSFDGVDDSVKVLSNSSLNFDSKPLTWMVWIYMSTLPDNTFPYIIHKAGSSNYVTQGMALRIVEQSSGGHDNVIRWNWTTSSGWLLADSANGTFTLNGWT